MDARLTSSFSAAARAASLLLACGCFGSHGASEADAAVDPGRDAAIDLGVDAGPVECEDDDPCTIGRSVGGRCRFEPAADGTACDDGDSCTGADSCEGGVCRGDADEGELLANITPRFRNGGTGVGAERFVFFRNTDESSELFLVRASEERFEILDEVDLPTAVSSIESLKDELAVYTTPTGGGLLDLTGDRLGLRGTYSVGGRSREVAVTRDRLWVCAAPDWLTTVLHEYALPDLDSPSRIASGESRGCRSVVSSSDGEHALLTDTEMNVYRLEPSLAGAAVPQALGFTAETLHAGGGHLVAMSAEEVVLRRESDGSVVDRVTGTFGSARYTGRGLEVFGATATHPGETGLSVYTLDGAGALVERSWEPIESDPPRGVARWVSHDDALRADARLFVLEPTAPHLREVSDPDVRWPGTALVDGRTVYLRDGSRTVRVDATDPRAPVVVSGGPHSGRSVLALEEGPDGRVALHGGAVTLDSVLLSWPGLTPPWIDLVVRVFEDDREVRDVASFTLPLDARLGERVHLAGNHFYQTTFALNGEAAPLRIRRWPTDALLAGRMLAGFDRTWPEVTKASAMARIHDDEATAIGAHWIGDDVMSTESEIFWLSLTSDEVARFELPGWGVVDVAVRGDRVLVMAARFMRPSSSQDSLLLALERRGDRLEEVGRVEWVWPYSARSGQVLAFDGTTAYLQFPNGVEAGIEGNTMMALRFDDLAGPRATYRLPSPGLLQSFVEAEFGLVLARSDALHIARPWCD